MAASSKASQVTPTASSASKSAGTDHKFLLAVAVVIIVVLIIAYFSLTANAISNPKYQKLAELLSGGSKVSLYVVANTLGYTNLTYLLTLGNNTNISYAGKYRVAVSYDYLNYNIGSNYSLSSVRNGNYSRATFAINLLKHEFSGVAIVKPNEVLSCMDQNQTANLNLFGTQPTTQEVPDYRCLAVAYNRSSTVTQLNSTLGRQGLKIIKDLLDQIYINATTIKMSSYQGNQCVYMKGYMSSNNIDILKLANISAKTLGSSGTTLSAAVSGPYSLCVSATGTPISYNFSFVTNVSVYYSSPSQGKVPIFVNMSLNGSATQISRVIPSQVDLSSPPYKVYNGTCVGQITIPLENYYTNFESADYKCGNVEMNSSGYVKIQLSPAASSTFFGITSNETTMRILGISCDGNIGPAIPFNASLPTLINHLTPHYTFVNITASKTSNLTLIAKCPLTGSVLGNEYSGTLGVAAIENSTSGLITTQQIGSFSVFATSTSSFGSNQNTGPVSAVNVSG